MRKPHERCETHDRAYCWDSVCKTKEGKDFSSSTDGGTTAIDIATSILIGPLSQAYTDPGC